MTFSKFASRSLTKVILVRGRRLRGTMAQPPGSQTSSEQTPSMTRGLLDQDASIHLVRTNVTLLVQRPAARHQRANDRRSPGSQRGVDQFIILRLVWLRTIIWRGQASVLGSPGSRIAQLTARSLGEFGPIAEKCNTTPF